MNDNKSGTSTMQVGNIRPIKDRIFIGLWALWAVFVVIPGLLLIVFGLLTFPFPTESHLSDWRITAGVSAVVILCTGVIGYIVQFVVVGYGSPLRLLHGPA